MEASQHKSDQKSEDEDLVFFILFLPTANDATALKYYIYTNIRDASNSRGSSRAQSANEH